ncbi:hypothetical protein [Streptomyces hydrogenans]
MATSHGGTLTAEEPPGPGALLMARFPSRT